MTAEKQAQRQIQTLTFLLNCRLVSWTEEACSRTNLPLAVLGDGADVSDVATTGPFSPVGHGAERLSGRVGNSAHTHTRVSTCIFSFAYDVCTFISPFVPTPTCGRDENVGAHTLIYTYYENRNVLRVELFILTYCSGCCCFFVRSSSSECR